jgi:hypothetical protein
VQTHVNLGALYARSNRLAQAADILNAGAPLATTLTTRWPGEATYENARAAIWDNLTCCSDASIDRLRTIGKRWNRANGW